MWRPCALSRCNALDFSNLYKCQQRPVAAVMIKCKYCDHQVDRGCTDASTCNAHYCNAYAEQESKRLYDKAAALEQVAADNRGASYSAAACSLYGAADSREREEALRGAAKKLDENAARARQQADQAKQCEDRVCCVCVVRRLKWSAHQDAPCAFCQGKMRSP